MNQLVNLLFADSDKAFWSLWCIIGLFLLLAACPRAFGEPVTASETGELSAVVDDERGEVDRIASSGDYKLEKNSKDPFKPLVVKPPPVDVQREERGKDVRPTPTPTPIPVPMLKIDIQGICGNDSGRWALAIFEGQPRVLTQDMTVDGKFKVVELRPDSVIVFSFRENARRSFSLAGKEK
ncbi:MAG: hypothetical protein WA705_27080 [Candidatus Ozemobacteraceae bacterium]